MHLSLPIPDTQNPTLIDCLTEFVKEEALEEEEKWSCPNCNRRTQSTKKFDIWKVPPVLIICLKRFKYRKNSGTKITKRVAFPFYDL